MTSYESNILQEHVDALYSRVSALAPIYAAAGAVVAWAAVYLLEPRILTDLRLPPDYSLIPFQIMAAIIAAIVGGVWGYGKGLALKLQAQMALCQRKIEQNTSHLEAIALNISHLVEIEQNARRLEKIEEKIEEEIEKYISQSEERMAVLSLSH